MTQLELYERLKNYILKDYPSARISLIPIKKLNESYNGIQVSFNRDKLSPVFNLDKIMDNIKTDSDFENMISFISEEIKNAVIFSSVDLNILNSYKMLKDHLCVDVIPQKGNEDYLNMVPNKTFNRDMSIIVKAILSDSLSKDRLSIVTIDNKMVKQLGVTNEDLCGDAIKNSFNVNPSEIMYIQDFLCGDDYQEAPWTEAQDNAIVPIRILLTQTGTFASSVILDSTILQELANRLDDSFYLIPTNNGALTIPVKYGNAKEVVKIIQDVLDKDGLVQGMKSIGELQRYDKESKTLEPNAVYEDRINKVKEEVEKQDRDTGKTKTEKEKDIITR